jgi:ubiquitin-activating enzyme E1 C
MSVETQAARAVDEEVRWKHLDQIRRNAGPFTDPDATNEEFLAQFAKFKILVMFVHQLSYTQRPSGSGPG